MIACSFFWSFLVFAGGGFVAIGRRSRTLVNVFDEDVSYWKFEETYTFYIERIACKFNNIHGIGSNCVNAEGISLNCFNAKAISFNFVNAEGISSNFVDIE